MNRFPTSLTCFRSRRFGGRDSRRGAILLPIIGIMVLIVFMVGLFLLTWLERLVLEAEAMAVAEATALAAARQAVAVADASETAAPGGGNVSFEHLVDVARANGLNPRAFHPLTPGDVQVAASEVRVTVRPRRAWAEAQYAIARVAPAEQGDAAATPDAGDGDTDADTNGRTES